MMLTGSTQPAILTNSRWRAVSWIDPRLNEKCSVTAMGQAQISPAAIVVLA